MEKVLIASKNGGKIAEFRRMLAPRGYEVVSLLDVPDAPDVEETGDTFQENARLKAETISKLYNCLVIADDSGLAVDALDGRPGVYSARFAGEEKNDQRNIEKVLNELIDVPMPDRTARFCCVLAVSGPNRQTIFYKGECDGVISMEPIGTGGFGYDPIFYIPKKGKTFAELDAEEKNNMSHRALAMKELEQHWSEIFN